VEYNRPKDFPLGVVASKLLREISNNRVIQTKCVQVRELRDCDKLQLIFAKELDKEERFALDKVVAEHEAEQRLVSVLEENINSAATAAPTENDDETNANSVGQMWIDTSHKKAYVCLDATPEKAMWKCVTTHWFNAYDAGGNIYCSKGYVPITWDTEVHKDSVFLHEHNAAQVTVAYSTKVLVRADVTVRHFRNNSRTDSVARLMMDEGSGGREVPGTKAYMYNRNQNQGINTASISRIVNLKANSKLWIEVSRNSGGGDLMTQGGGCRILLQTIN